MAQTLLPMSEKLFDFICSVSEREEPLLAELREETRKTNPRFNMQMTPHQAQFMQTLVMATGARRVLEVGTFTGYGTLAMALALPPDGKIVTLDVNDEWTKLGRKYWAKSGVADRIELRLGPGAASMDALAADGGAGTFDMVFIDADKPNYPEYWERGLVLLRQGGLLVADNTLFQGMVEASVTDAEMRKKWASRPPEVQQELIDAVHALRAFDKKVHKDERVHLSMVPVADGMTFGVKL